MAVPLRLVVARTAHRAQSDSAGNRCAPTLNAVASRLVSRLSPRNRRAVFVLAVAAYVLFSLFDWLTTAVALGVGGEEGNPVAASVFAVFGDAGLLAFKAIVVAVIIGILVLIPRRIMSLRVATWIAAIFAVVAAVTVIHNVQAYASLLHQQHGPTYHSTAPAARLIEIQNV